MRLGSSSFFLLSLLAVCGGVNAFSLRDVLAKGGSGGGGGGHGGGGGGRSSSSGGSRGSSGSSGSSGSGGGSSGSSGSSGGGGSVSSPRGASTGRGGSGDTGKPAIRTTPGSETGGRVANFFSRGGGKAIVLGAGAYFVGRKIGGGLREQVVGSPRYASGYPYTSGDVMKSGVSGQPFPFGFWPVYWGYHGYGGEYIGGEGHPPNTTVTDQRPGGELVYVQLSPVKGSNFDITYMHPELNDTYYMIGDRASVEAVMSLLTDPPLGASASGGGPFGCAAQQKPIIPFITINPDGSPILYPNITATNTTTTNNNTTTTGTNSTIIPSGNTTTNSTTISTTNTTTLPIRFENVMTWYRASSFALAYENYTNAYALAPLNETTDVGWDHATPLPYHQTVSGFLSCVNKTIMAALPILDPEERALSPGEIAGIVIGSVCGALLLGIGAWYGWNVWQKKKKYTAVASKEQSLLNDEKDPEAKK
ncbi:hypothetical protein FRC17_001468, partial [Serendipita sp. 399]